MARTGSPLAPGRGTVKIRGTVTPPGDKSITHRALIIGGMLRAPLSLGHPLTSADARSSARVLRQLGVRVGPLRGGHRVEVQGAPWHVPEGTLNCGNSGTTARLMLGALAGCPFAARLTGDRSLRRRPMRRVTVPLTSMGATIREERGDGLPLTIQGGALSPLQYDSPVASAQVKSALMLAALGGRVAVTITEPARSRDHTERMLRFFGVDIDAQGTVVQLDGASFQPAEVPPQSIDIPGDPSSAAFLVAVALLAESGELHIEGVGVNPTRTGFLRVLERMGATIQRENERESAGEPVADLLVRPGALTGTRVDASEIPSSIDEVSILAVLAARAAGETRFCSVAELRVKESDRLNILAANLRTLGIEAAVEGDDLVVVGSDHRPRGRIETGGDHRIAMAFAVLGTVPGAAVALSETASVGVSYPRFFADLERIRGE